MEMDTMIREEFPKKISEMLTNRQFREIRGALSILAPQDVALVVEELEESERVRVFRLSK